MRININSRRATTVGICPHNGTCELGLLRSLYGAVINLAKMFLRLCGQGTKQALQAVSNSTM